ncbi:MAG: competence/damage-inducible protein A [Armatimonadetes bacterium]|nr:competence/damage-inducible protein A [Armatimonadota bacterium]
MPTAALVIIGNEILSGKTRDQNTPFLTARLFDLGVEVREIRVVPDELEVISRTVRRLAAGHDYVLTSGGIGPTHDDLTIPAVAQAMDRKVVRSPALEHLLKRYFGADELTIAQGRLAEIPEGAELIYPEGSNYPQVVVGNVYMFPGIPDLLRKKFDQVAEFFRSQPFLRERLDLPGLETDIAAILNQAVEAFPAVRFGSYPYEQRGQWRVELVLECRSAEPLAESVEFLRSRLPTGMETTSS